MTELFFHCGFNYSLRLILNCIFPQIINQSSWYGCKNLFLLSKTFLKVIRKCYLNKNLTKKKVNSTLRDLSEMLIFYQTFPFGLKMHIFNHQTFPNRNFRTLIADFSIFIENIIFFSNISGYYIFSDFWSSISSPEIVYF